MSYLGIHDRFQIQIRRLVEFFDKENVIRFVDAFLEQLVDLKNKAFINHKTIFRTRIEIQRS